MRKGTVSNGVPPRSSRGPQQAGTRKQRRAAAAIARSAAHKERQLRIAKIEEHQRVARALDAPTLEAPVPARALSPLEEMAAKIRERS